MTRFGSMRLLLPALLCASPAASADVSVNIGVVSDYRYRGLSLSRGKPVVQGELVLEHGSGAYAAVWASTLGSAEPDAEVDLTLGFEQELAEGFSNDLSGAYFIYPRAVSSNYFEATAVATLSQADTSESLGISYAPAQRGAVESDNIYLFGSVEGRIPSTPLTIRSALGYERGAFNDLRHSGKWDWCLGGELEARGGQAWFGLCWQQCRFRPPPRAYGVGFIKLVSSASR